MAAGLLLAQQPAQTVADHGGRPIGSSATCQRPGRDPQRCVSVGNNWRHFVYFDASLTDGLASSLRDSMAEDYDPTNLSVREQSAITPATDVIAFSQDYGDNGAAGWVHCPPDVPQGTNAAGDRWCQQQEVHFNINARFGAFFADDASRDHVTCHELGHTLGLRHWGNPPQSAGPVAATCMNANTPDGPVELHQIDRDHLNAYAAYRPPVVHPRRGNTLAVAPPGGAGAAVAAWEGTQVEAVELEHYASLDALVSSADAVVRGRVIGVAAGRIFGDRSSPRLAYAAATVRVEALLAGSLPRGHAAQLTLEIPLFDGPDAIAALAGSLPQTESILFLRNKAASARAAGLSMRQQYRDAAYYRLSVLGAVIVSDARTARLPLGEPDALAGLEGRRFSEVVRLVRESAS